MGITKNIKQIVQDAIGAKESFNKIKENPIKEKAFITKALAYLDLIEKWDTKEISELKKIPGSAQFIEECEDIWLLVENIRKKLNDESIPSEQRRAEAVSILDRIIALGKYKIIHIGAAAKSTAQRKVVNSAREALESRRQVKHRDELIRIAESTTCPIHENCKYVFTQSKEGTSVSDGTTGTLITIIPKSPEIGFKTSRKILKALAEGEPQRRAIERG